MQFDVQFSFLFEVNSLGNCIDVALALEVEAEAEAEVDFDVDAPTFTPEFDVDAVDWP